MIYSKKIKPYHKKNNEKDLFHTLFSQYAGEDKWQKLLKDSSEILHNRSWSGQVTLTLEKFIFIYLKLYAMMTQCDNHADYQIPNELAPVGFLINYIKCKYPGLNSDTLMVKGYTGLTGKMNKFEDAAAYLTPWEPVANSFNTNRKHGKYEISNTSFRGAQVLET